MVTFVLILFMGTAGAPTSQTIAGFTSMAACTDAAATARKDIGMVRYSCVEVK